MLKQYRSHRSTDCHGASTIQSYCTRAICIHVLQINNKVQVHIHIHIQVHILVVENNRLWWVGLFQRILKYHTVCRKGHASVLCSLLFTRAISLRPFRSNSHLFLVTATQTTHNCTFLSVLIKTRRSRTYQFLRHVFSMFVLGCVKISSSLMIAKTEFLIIGTPRQVSKLNINDITVGNSVVTPSDTVRNLGVSFDSCLNMEAQISNTCKSAFYMLYNLRRIRKYLDQTNAETLIHAFISSKIDYCNGLLYGLPDTQIMKLQRIQNACARLVCNTSKFCHITPLLKNLHWLPIRQRIAFKILLIVYKALNGQAPCYISELLAWKANTYSHNLRSSKDTLLLKPPNPINKNYSWWSRIHLCST